jgi:hypothetical protein
MPPTTAGRYRVYASPRDRDEWLFVSVGEAGNPDREFEPTYVPRSSHGDLDEDVASLRPGHLVEATIEWDDGSPRIVALDVLKHTLLEFVPEATNLFEAARKVWAGAAAMGDAMNSQVTYSTDGDPNGVLYVFAEQPGAQDLFEEFQSGLRPLEPLIERINENEPDSMGASSPETPSISADGTLAVPSPDDDGDDEDEDEAPDHGLGRDREVFVMDPAGEPFVLAYIVLRKGGILADTIRDTYHCPRPDGEN